MSMNCVVNKIGLGRDSSRTRDKEHVTNRRKRLCNRIIQSISFPLSSSERFSVSRNGSQVLGVDQSCTENYLLSD